MSKEIEGVPESVTREQYLSFFRSVGFEPENIKSLRFMPNSIEAVVFERIDGLRFLVEDQECICPKTLHQDVDPSCEAQHGFAKHTVIIPVTDDGIEGA